MQLVDGNSVNYAESADGYHDQTDSKPVSKYDPKVRKKIGKGWKDPQIDSPNRSNYFDRKASENNANKRLRGNQ